MNQITQGIITQPYRQMSVGHNISFSFQIKGFDKAENLYKAIKRIYNKSFLHDFQNVFTSKVE